MYNALYKTLKILILVVSIDPRCPPDEFFLSPEPCPPPGVLGVLLINVFFGWNIF